MRLLHRAVLVPCVLCLMIAFAVEPTTSTQYDVAEGRGVVVVHGRTHQAPNWAGVEQAGRILRAPLRIISLLLALLVVLPLARGRARRVEPARMRSVSRWRTPVLRGPPALV